VIETYSDEDWASYQRDRQSIMGPVSLYCGKKISWFFRKQAYVSLSTAEAEYVAAAAGAHDLINIQGLCKDLNEGDESILYVDSRRTIILTQSYENSKKPNTLTRNITL
jgi:hypothetical protein